jgi:hypothetical protein
MFVTFESIGRRLFDYPPPPYISRQKFENREVIAALFSLYSG